MRCLPPPAPGERAGGRARARSRTREGVGPGRRPVPSRPRGRPASRRGDEEPPAAPASLAAAAGRLHCLTTAWAPPAPRRPASPRDVPLEDERAASSGSKKRKPACYCIEFPGARLAVLGARNLHAVKSCHLMGRRQSDILTLLRVLPGLTTSWHLLPWTDRSHYTGFVF